MKKIPLLLLCLVLTASAHAQRSIHQYIVHFYPTATSSDKPVDELTIKYGDSTQMQDNDFKVVIITDEATLSSMVTYIKGNIKTHLLSQNADFGSFGVILDAQTALVTRYYLNSHTESVAYFKRLLTILTANHADQNVINELQKIVGRISY